MKVELIARRRIGRHLPGEKFSASTAEAKLFLALKLAERADTPASEPDRPRSKRHYKRRDMTAEPQAAAETPQTDEAPSDHKAWYYRRDTTAEE